MLDNIRIVLVNTSHPGNIGSTARAMKTMGLSRLYLVDPKRFPAMEATTMAAGADDVLANAKIVNSLTESIADCHLTIGTSVRDRSLQQPILNPKECSEKILMEPSSHEIALIFGRENYGLYNEELQLCHYHLQIPSNPTYGSLNLAAAVQIVAYEIFAARQLAIPQKITPTVDLSSSEELEGFYQHLERVLLNLEFISHQHPNRIMPRLRRLYNRARIDKVEINILRGILSEMEKKCLN